MCIEGSVGENGQNSTTDIIVVQVLLNYNRPPPLLSIGVDGLCGGQTKAAIREFQSRVLKTPTPDGRVDPGGRTLDAMRLRIPIFLANLPFSDWMMKGIMPTATHSKIRLYLPHLWIGMVRWGINTALRAAHFLSQLGHESGSFLYAEEIATGAAYEGRKDLGNTEPGDGTRFKGRGLIQLTGRSNYATYGEAIKKNLIEGENPKLLATDPSLAVDVACWYWNAPKINRHADADDIVAVTKAVNGGLTGLEDRKAYLRRAKFFFRPMF